VNAIQTLPPSYQHQGTLDLSTQPLVLAALSLGSILLGGLAVGMMLWVLPLLRPDLIELSVTIGGLADLLRFLLIALIVMVVMVVMVVLHEGLHGLMFWHFTGDRPTFGFKGLYAYAAAPNWYLPRNQHRKLVAVSISRTSTSSVVCRVRQAGASAMLVLTGHLRTGKGNTMTLSPNPIRPRRWCKWPRMRYFVATIVRSIDARSLCCRGPVPA
jgi:hypothetical protein